MYKSQHRLKTLRPPMSALLLEFSRKKEKRPEDVATLREKKIQKPS